MNFLILLAKEDYNDATSYYVDTIKEAITNIGHTSDIINSWKNITKNDYVIIINYKYFFFVNTFTRCKNIIFWFQGCLPEEVLLSFGKLEGTIKKFFYNRVEKCILKNTRGFFFVSDAMINHLQKKWSCLIDNFVVMPCFNKEIRESSFYNEGKYTSPTFVYAGSLSKWQCIEETLDLYKSIEDTVANCKLILLTADKEKANHLIRERGIKSFKVDYVPLEKLDNELEKYKYAFLIREDIVVNHVATPTKMNTYMANGLLPIYTDVVDAFSKISSENSYIISSDITNLKTSVLNQVLLFESSEIIARKVYESHSHAFHNFYNKNKYLGEIEKMISQLVISNTVIK